MAGNTLGVRRSYAYTSDTGQIYSIVTDKDLGDAVSGTLDDTHSPPPRRFKPRGVHVQATIGGVSVRKFLICFTTDSPLYEEDKSAVVSIDGASFKTSGRRGESYAFGFGNPTT